MSLTARVKEMYYRYFPERDPAHKAAGDEMARVFGHVCFTQEEFDQAVRDLPLQHREAMLNHKAGLSPLQIAREMGVTEAIARKWIMKGYSGLRMRLKWPDDVAEVLSVEAQPLNDPEYRRRDDDADQRPS